MIRKMSGKRASLSIGAPVDEPGGSSFAGTFERKEDIWVPFLDLEAIKILCLGSIWNFSEEEGCPELISDYEAQRACL